MKRTNPWNRVVQLGEGTPASTETAYALNVAVVYQDAMTRSRAMDLCGRATRFAGAAGIRASSWRMAALIQPRIFPDAVQAAAAADVIVVSAYASVPLPLELCTWTNAWLPRRWRTTGALVALIDEPDSPEFQTSLLHDYLQAVARRGHLDFLTGRRCLIPEPAGRPQSGWHNEEEVFAAAAGAG